jgi:predicted enzyme involved in methoxymalonyl-ACP biosynthesis
MSCRVFGRQLEHEAMNIAVEISQQRGIRALRADYIATKKNGVISGLYGDLGFSPVDQPGQVDGVTRWSIATADYEPRRTFILRRDQ